MAAVGRQEEAVRAAAVPSIVYDRGALNLNWFVAQALTVFLYVCLAAWPFFPILLQWRPWPIHSTLLFLFLLTILAWVIVYQSSSIYAALGSSFLVLMLTGLTAVEYTASQMKME